MTDEQQGLPLADLRVLELGQLLAGPFCGQLLGDFGAEVIKLEDPGKGDPMRQWGREKPHGRSLWWPVVARNKRSVTCDLRSEAGQDLVRQLVARSDVLVENFRPGTLERWGLSPEQLWEVNPRLVVTRVTGFGQTGPYAPQAGYGSIGEAMGGIRYTTGDPDSPPSRTGISLGDSLAAVFATLGTLVALHARERTGPVLPNVSPSNVYPTADGDMVLLAANQDTVFRRLAGVMGQPDLAVDERYATHSARGRHMEQLDELIAQWTAQHDAEPLLALLAEGGVPAGRIFRAQDMLTDPHFAAREAIVRLAHPQFGELAMHNVFPRLSATPGRVRHAGPELGADNTTIYGDLLGLTDAQLARLQADGVI